MLPFPTPRSAHDVLLTVETGCTACSATGRRPGTSTSCGGCNGTGRGSKTNVNIFQLLELLQSAQGELEEQHKKASTR